MSRQLDVNCEFKKSGQEFSTPEYLLLGAGPVNITARVAKALSRQCLNPLGDEIFKVSFASFTLELEHFFCTIDAR